MFIENEQLFIRFNSNNWSMFNEQSPGLPWVWQSHQYTHTSICRSVLIQSEIPLFYLAVRTYLNQTRDLAYRPPDICT